MRFRVPNQQQGQDELVNGVSNLFRSLAMAPQLRQQAQQQAQLQQQQSALLDSQRRSHEAQAGFNFAKTQEQQDSNDRASIGGIMRGAALRTGIPQSLVPDAQSYLDTGALPNGKYSTSETFEGPPQVLPPSLAAGNLDKFRDAAASIYQGLQLGDKSDNIARAGAIDNAQALRDKVLAGGLSAPQLAAAQGAMEGKAQFNNVGNTGAGFNVYSGEGNVISPGLQALFSDESKGRTAKEKAQAGASVASAANSYASATQHKVSTDKLRQEIDLGTKGVLQQTDQGLMLVNPRTAQAVPVMGANGQVAGKPGGPKTLNEGQAKANIYGGRMMEADAVLSKLAKEGTIRPGGIKQTLEGIAGAIPLIGSGLSEAAGSATNFTQSAEQQQVEQAQRDFVNAVLRRESGAAISPGEFANAQKQYFPQIGDKDPTLEQKARNRALATQLMLQEVPDAMRYQRQAAPTQTRNVTVDY